MIFLIFSSTGSCIKIGLSFWDKFRGVLNQFVVFWLPAYAPTFRIKYSPFSFKYRGTAHTYSPMQKPNKKQTTNPTERCPPWGNNNQSANREVSLSSQQLKFHCLIRNSPTPLATINQINLVLDPSLYLYFFHNEMEFILTLSLEAKSSKLSVSYSFLYEINQSMKILNPTGISFIWATLWFSPHWPEN